MSALDIQIGGEHYKNAKIQPVQYIEANELGFLEGCVVKRITRHDKPTGKGRQDIEKAIHELQLLLEFRYPQAPSTADVAPTTFYERVAEIDMSVQRAVEVCLAREAATHTTSNPPVEDTYAEFAARLGNTERGVGMVTTLGAGYELTAMCPECRTVSRGGRLHVCTCSQLTAPEEYKAEAQVAFDEAAEISEALARQVSAGTLADLVAEQAAAGLCTCGNDDYTHRPHCALLHKVEPAAAMDDDSPRMQAIGQNGNDGEHYDDPFAGAPKWAKYKAQDADGEWFHYSHEPVLKNMGVWARSNVAGNDCEFHTAGEPNPNWRDTLITRT